MEESKPIVFKLDNEQYGVDIDRVEGIEKEQNVVRVPNSVPYIKGIMNLRGEIIAVYNLRNKFTMNTPAPEHPQYIVVRIGEHKVALEVDGVTEIQNISSEDIFDMPEIVTKGGLLYFEKIIRSKTGLVMLIDVDHLLTEEELGIIDEMVKQ